MLPPSAALAMYIALLLLAAAQLRGPSDGRTNCSHDRLTTHWERRRRARRAGQARCFRCSRARKTWKATARKQLLLMAAATATLCRAYDCR